VNRQGSPAIAAVSSAIVGDVVVVVLLLLVSLIVFLTQNLVLLCISVCVVSYDSEFHSSQHQDSLCYQDYGMPSSNLSFLP